MQVEGVGPGLVVVREARGHVGRVEAVCPEDELELTLQCARGNAAQVGEAQSLADGLPFGVALAAVLLVGMIHLHCMRETGGGRGREEDRWHA